MKKTKCFQANIEALSEEEFMHPREWFAEKDWQCWDAQLEKDAATGKLDFLLEEAITAKAQGKLQEL